MLEKYIMIFMNNFHAEQFHCDKFRALFPTDENNHEKLLMYFFNIGHHVLYPVIKFELKIQLVCGETKKEKYHQGVD